MGESHKFVNIHPNRSMQIEDTILILCNCELSKKVSEYAQEMPQSQIFVINQYTGEEKIQNTEKQTTTRDRKNIIKLKQTVLSSLSRAIIAKFERKLRSKVCWQFIIEFQITAKKMMLKKYILYKPVVACDIL